MPTHPQGEPLEPIGGEVMHELAGHDPRQRRRALTAPVLAASLCPRACRALSAGMRRNHDPGDFARKKPELRGFR